MTARFVKVWMAAANFDVAPIPRVALVAKVCESTIEIVLLSELTVRIVPDWKLNVIALGLIPTLIVCVWVESGLNAVIKLPWVETLSKRPGLVVLVTKQASNTRPGGVEER